MGGEGGGLAEVFGAVGEVADLAQEDAETFVGMGGGGFADGFTIEVFGGFEVASGVGGEGLVEVLEGGGGHGVVRRVWVGWWFCGRLGGLSVGTGLGEMGQGVLSPCCGGAGVGLFDTLGELGRTRCY